jgi:hypothetical protein
VRDLRCCYLDGWIGRGRRGCLCLGLRDRCDVVDLKHFVDMVRRMLIERRGLGMRGGMCSIRWRPLLMRFFGGLNVARSVMEWINC